MSTEDCVFTCTNPQVTGEAFIVVVFPSTVVKQNMREKAPEEEHERIVRVLSTEGVAAITLPLSFQDIQIGRKHGRPARPQRVSLFEVYRKPSPSSSSRKKPGANNQQQQQQQIIARKCFIPRETITSIICCSQVVPPPPPPLSTAPLTVMDRFVHCAGHRSDSGGRVVRYPNPAHEQALTRELMYRRSAFLLSACIIAVPCVVLDAHWSTLFPSSQPPPPPPKATNNNNNNNNNNTFSGENMISLRSPHQPIAKAAAMSAFTTATTATTTGGVKTALIQMPCGSGKTVVGLAVAQDLLSSGVIDGVLVLVHTRDLVRQWRERVQQFISCADMREVIQVDTLQSMIGSGGGGGDAAGEVVKPRKKVSKKEMARLEQRQSRKCQLVIVDEVHHIPATTFRKVYVHCLPPGRYHYALGLSGTMDRKDGQTTIIHMLFGNKPPVFCLQAIDLKRSLGALVQYRVFFPLVASTTAGGDDAAQLSADDGNVDGGMAAATTLSMAPTDNSYLIRNGVHARSTVRASAVMNQVIMRDMVSMRKHEHVMVLVLTLGHVAQLLRSFLAILSAETVDTIARTVSLDVKIGGAGVRGNPVIRDLLQSIQQKQELAEQQTGRQNKITIGTMHFVGEGFDDGTIDCIVFADQALNMMQNGNRLRDARAGTIAYVTSAGLIGADACARKDLATIRKDLFTHIGSDTVHIIKN